jgi:two-component system, OmpR family, sensor histidine kinase TctE
MRLFGAHSLQLQLALRLAALYVAATAIVVAVLIYQAYSTADTLTDEDLSRRAEQIASFVTIDGTGEPRLDLPPKLDATYGASAGIFLFVVRRADGRVIGASYPEIQDLVSGWPAAGAVPSYFRLERFGRAEQSYYGFTTKADSRAGPLSVTVARAADANEFVHSVLREFVLDIAWIIPLVVGATLLIGVLGIRRGLRPLRQASDRAAAIDPGSISVRLPEQGLPVEVRPLVEAVNRALDRLERGFAVQREFTANAAHELRTPLSIVTAGLEQLDGNGEVEKLRQDVARMNRLVEQLLRVARLDAVALGTLDTVDLSIVAAEVVGYMAPVVIGQGRRIAVQGTERPVQVKGNRHAIEDAIRNLVENAVAHAPPRTEVVITVDPAGSISVTDHGTGVRPEDRDKIFERFWRGFGESGSGAGLGLAIVKEIMKAHQGSVQVEDNPGGGAVFRLLFARLPAEGLATA